MVAAAARRQTEGLVTFDPFQHLRQVTDLIAQAFAGELGPAARHALYHMQRMARWGALGFWLLEPEAGVLGTRGFVWLEEGGVVGNISLRRAASPGGWMIGNVAVHPDCRGHGIGRALVEATVEKAAERGGSWIGLEVREDNAAARRLYGKMGFARVGAALEMARPAGLPWPQARAASITLRRARAADSDALYRLAQEGLDHPYREVLEVRRSFYRAGWEAQLEALLEGRWQDWRVLEEDQIVGALRMDSHWLGHWHQLEPLVAPDWMT
jgi:ribosomal protein S18 acetylase RimI-like enzyme